ncbi:hypothetical protein [Liquorilactobacillus uvarum]|uniref:YdhG-like domain-containing protein n=1 Tax=Liquorilactobacillus uvarum DSM 19971 TaxID=1423812 RepID=A0A0R1PWB6_9LACO|nr:hypothetical protein [Liquorilactobacillus uvarum]KRL36806.1 hypothetical protein FD20_GL001027 [Liquorilactobacillus uvarum DSM 19971]
MVKQSFSDFEREAMRERAREIRNEQGKKKNPSADLLEKIAEMPENEAFIASQLDLLVQKLAPQLHPKTWYGMPAYANDDGKVVLFFQTASKFKTRYNTLGFNDNAILDDGDMWPTAYALNVWNEKISGQVGALIKKATQKDNK